MCVQHVGLYPVDHLKQALFNPAHEAQLLQASERGARRRSRGAEEVPAVDLFLGRTASPMLGRSQMKGIPAKRALFFQNRQGSECIATMQRNGVVEEMEDAHNAEQRLSSN